MKGTMQKFKHHGIFNIRCNHQNHAILNLINCSCFPNVIERLHNSNLHYHIMKTILLLLFLMLMFPLMGVGAIKTTTKFQGSSAYGWWVINDSCTSTDVSFYPQKVKLLCKAKVNPSVQRWKMWASTITFGIVAMENR